MFEMVRKIFTKEQRRFLKFCIVGASGVPVNLGFTWIGNHLLFASFEEFWRKAAAFCLGIMISILTNFLLNDGWTWKDRETFYARFFSRLARFYLVCSLAAVIQFGTAMALRFEWRVHYLLAQLCGIFIATAVNYVANNFWTYQKKNNSATLPPVSS